MNLEFLTDAAGENPEQEEQLEALKKLEDGVYQEHIGEEKETLGSIKDFFESLFQKEKIAGDPEKDMECWHMQAQDYSCAVVCQEFVAEQLLDREFTEAELSRLAYQNGWYDPTSGTPINDVGNILEALGLTVERQDNVSLSELSRMLERGEKVICGVNNMILANPALANLPGMSANHAVQVIGIDSTDPNNIQVILNDPGVPNGGGIRHSLDTFMAAWSTSGNFTVSAEKE